MRDLVEYMAKALVDHPEDVRVVPIRGAHATIFKLYVNLDDKGWVIGRRGRVANAMRALMRVSASVQGKRRAILEIV